MIKSIVDALQQHAATQPDKPFCIFESRGETRELTFSQLLINSELLAEFFTSLGIMQNDVVLLFLDQSSDIFAYVIGLQIIGAIPSLMPLPSAKQHPEVFWASHEALFERVLPKAIICAERFLPLLKALQGPKSWMAVSASEVDIGARSCRRPEKVATNPEQIALLQHSSGTTSLKKGVMLSHQAVVRHVHNYSTALDYSGETIVSWLPYYHDMGLIACFALPLVKGATVMLQDPFDWAVRPLMLLEAIERHQASFCWLPNFAFEHLLRARRGAKFDLSSMTAFVSCSEPVKKATIDRFIEGFADCGVTPESVQVCYAAAETVFAISQTKIGHRCSTVRADRIALEQDGIVVPVEGTEKIYSDIVSCGSIVPEVEVIVVNDVDQEVPDGHVGEIAVRGEAIFEGYYNLPSETSRRFHNGWYMSCDLGFKCDNELFVLGRKDDLVIMNGKNLFSHEIEHLLVEIQELKPGRNVVFGLFCESLGSEELIVVGELRGDQDVEHRHLQRKIKQLIFDKAGVVPRDVRLVGEGWLIKTTSGKISRQLNRIKYVSEATTRKATTE